MEQQAAVQAIGYATSTVPSGKPFALFNTCRTNLVEGENNAALACGIQHCEPPVSICLWLQQAASALSSVQEAHAALASKNLSLTTIGLWLFHLAGDEDQLEVSHVLSQSQEEVRLEVLSYLRQATTSSATGQDCVHKNIVVVTRDGASCGCTSCDQLDSLCWHGCFGIKHCSENRNLCRILFDGNCLIADAALHRSILSCFHCQDPGAVPTIVMPTELELHHPIPATLFVNVPPRYKNNKSASAKQIRSSGEIGNANVQSLPRACSPCSTN